MPEVSPLERIVRLHTGCLENVSRPSNLPVVEPRERRSNVSGSLMEKFRARVHRVSFCFNRFSLCHVRRRFLEHKEFSLRQVIIEYFEEVNFLSYMYYK